MKVYICWGTFRVPMLGGHACRNAVEALREAGHDPEVIKSYGERRMPAFVNKTQGRKKVKEMTGEYTVPVLVTDEGEIITESKRIVEWARSHPASAAEGRSPAAA